MTQQEIKAVQIVLQKQWAIFNSDTQKQLFLSTPTHYGIQSLEDEEEEFTEYDNLNEALNDFNS